VSFNYLGQLDAGQAAQGLFGRSGYASGAMVSPQAERAHLIDINCMVVEGCLQAHWSYGSQVHEERTIARLAEHFLQRLQMIIQHCRESEGAYTPSDFPLLAVEE
jgi:non-ribosomal peptide synthase protein (TIGR01720 family)